MSFLNKMVVLTLPFVPKPIVHYFSKRYIAGPKVEDAIRVIRELNAKGIMATMDILGEEISNRTEAEQAAANYRDLLKTIDAHKLDTNVSIKPTHMGLELDKEFCYQNIRSVVEEAAKYNNFVRIDMEDHTTTSDTIEIFLRLKKDFDNVGAVIQAYMRRTQEDLNTLIDAGANLRYCKGIYNEPREVAYKDMAIINENYKYGLEKLLKAGCYVGIATHDEILIWHALRMIDELGLKKEEYEFQMLLGVDEQLRDIIVKNGHRLRVYVPFGEHWYAYSVRRLKENPNMAGYVFKAIFGL